MFIMRIVESFAYCILLDHMRSLEVYDGTNHSSQGSSVMSWGWGW